MIKSFWGKLFCGVMLLALIGFVGWNFYQRDEAIYYDSQHHAIHLENYRGRWVFVNIWAAWCAPCMDEMPILNQFYQQHRDQVMVLGINYDHISNQQLNQFAQQHKISFPLLSRFPWQQLGLHQLENVPVTVVLDPKGHIHSTLMGPQSESSLLAAMGQAAPPRPQVATHHQQKPRSKAKMVSIGAQSH